MQLGNFTKIKSFFFDNLNIKQTVFKNAFWLGAANVSNKALKFVLFIYIARILGATEYGKFTFALSFAGLFIMISDMGVSQIVTREFSREKEREDEFPAMLSLRIILGLIMLAVIFIGSFLVTQDFLIRKLIWVLGIFLFVESYPGIIFAFLHARQKMEYHSFASAFEGFVCTIAGLFILFNFPSVQNLSYGYLFSAFASLVLLLIIFHFKIKKLSFSLDKTIWKKFLLVSWPLALTGVATTVCNQTDSVMLGYFKQITETGWYNAAYRIIGVTFIPMGLFSTAIFPALSQSFGESKEKLQKIWDHFMEIMIVFAVPLTVGGILMAPKIINFMYGGSYQPSVLVFQILMLMVGIIFIYHPLSQILIIFDQQKRLFSAIAAGAVLNVILNSILIPKISLYGAAGATVLTHFLILLFLAAFTLKFTTVKILNRRILTTLLGVIIGSAIMYFAVSNRIIYSSSVLISVGVGVGVYFAVFYIYKKISDKFYKYQKNEI
jgi:O-antigen/teichoic acid export membrane protein